MAYRENFERWMNSSSLDAALRQELEAVAGDKKDLEERFYRELDFGTAGLRGIIGAGTNRMNVHVVRRATQGLADYLNKIPGAAERGVAIAYDSRHMSDVFAAETAAVRPLSVFPAVPSAKGLCQSGLLQIVCCCSLQA